MKTQSEHRAEVATRGRDEPGLLWRILMVAVGAGLAMTGWALAMTILFVFIGLPLFIFGLALMQAQER